MKCLSSLERPCKIVPQRYVIAVLTAFGVAMMFSHRVCFNIVLAQVANPKDSYYYMDEESIEEYEAVCYKEDSYNTDDELKSEFDWEASEIERIRRWYFYGYVFSNFLSGVLTNTYGGKNILCVGILLSSISTLLTPVSARLALWFLYCVKCLMGLGHGTVLPSIAALCANWCPPNERSRIHAVMYAGVSLGTIAGDGFTKILLSDFPGWDTVFYIFAAVGLVWCVTFYFFCYNSPSQHPFITEKERSMIEEQIAIKSRQKPKEIPWYQIFTSLPVIVLILINIGHAWLIFLISIETPKYFESVLNVNLQETGLQVTMPSLAMGVSCLTAGVACDWLIAHEKLSLTNNRKIFSLISNIVPVPFLLGASYSGCDTSTAIVCIVLAMTFVGLSYPSIKVNAVDLSPNYAGVLSGLANGSSAIAGLFMTDVVVNFIGTHEGTMFDWRKMFWFSCGIEILFTFPYGFFASGEVQHFNNELEELEE